MVRTLDGTGAVWEIDLGRVNAYLVADKTVTLVDAGTPRTTEKLGSKLATIGYDRSDIDHVLITHYDFDHVGGLASLPADIPIYGMEPDASLIAGSENPPIRSKKGLFQRISGVFVPPPSGPIKQIDDGATVGGFTAYHTPGHTPGHAIFHHTDLAVALLGDLVTSDGLSFDTPPWPLVDSNRENRRSIRALAARGLDFDIAGVGHGRAISDNASKALDALASQV